MRNWKQTNDISFQGDIDGELIPIKCECGYGGYWDLVISIYPDDPYSCPKCGREYYFKNAITVFVNKPKGDLK